MAGDERAGDERAGDETAGVDGVGRDAAANGAARRGCAPGEGACKEINLALQGGGAHGAFTWGVLDRLLEDGRLSFEAVSGASAGAMNAVALADGLARGGPEAARERLSAFWTAIGEAGRLSPLQRTPMDVLFGNWSLDHSPAYVLFDIMNRLASPYDVNPLNINPLREIVERVVDFENVRRCAETRLFISATNVETGRVKIFDQTELTVDMVMASACLPFMFQAVEIDGAHYWDGGYAGNPALFPFFYKSASNDVLLVQINPVERPGPPRTAAEILNRVNEITFNQSLLKELRAIDFVRRMIEEGSLDDERYKPINVHVVRADEKLLPLGASSKLNAEAAFLTHLFEIGREAAEGWLGRCAARVGIASSVDLRSLFQGPPL